MADISGRFLQLKAISPMLVGQTWETRIAADASGVLWQSIKGAPFTPLGGSGTDDPWFASTLAAIQGASVPAALLTNVVLKNEMMTLKPFFDFVPIGAGTVTLGPSALVMQTGTNANEGGTFDNTGSEKHVPNMRTSKWAVAAKVTKVANTPTCDFRICGLNCPAGGDIATVGIQGATSQTQYVLRTVTGGITNTLAVQSAAGTYDTLVIINDGTNIRVLVGLNGATPTATITQLSSVLAASPANVETFFSNGGTAANAGFKLDKLMVVQEAAS